MGLWRYGVMALWRYVKRFEIFCKSAELVGDSFYLISQFNLLFFINVF